MVIYHVTQQSYSVGTKLKASSRSWYLDAIRQRGLGWVDQLLEDHRPFWAPSRSSSKFGFSELSFCGAYADAEQIAQPNFYKLSVLRYWQAPMIMVNRINRAGQNSVESALFAKEYWRPRNKWHFLEVLFKSAVVVEKCEPPTAEDVRQAKRLYLEDHNRAIGM